MDAKTLGAILKTKLRAKRVDVIDESDQHAGHEGARQGGGHYRVTIVSDAFTAKSTIERHRMVYEALAEEIGNTIHALALKTIAPDEM